MATDAFTGETNEGEICTTLEQSLKQATAAFDANYANHLEEQQRDDWRRAAGWNIDLLTELRKDIAEFVTYDRLASDPVYVQKADGETVQLIVDTHLFERLHEDPALNAAVSNDADTLERVKTAASNIIQRDARKKLVDKAYASDPLLSALCAKNPRDLTNDQIELYTIANLGKMNVSARSKQSRFAMIMYYADLRERLNKIDLHGDTILEGHKSLAAGHLNNNLHVFYEMQLEEQDAPEKEAVYRAKSNAFAKEALHGYQRAEHLLGTLGDDERENVDFLKYHLGMSEVDPMPACAARMQTLCDEHAKKHS